MSEPRLLALLLTYRRPAAFERALQRIIDADPRPDRLVIVDNAPTDRTRAIGEGAAARHPWIEYVPSATNLGAAGGRALAMTRLLEDAGDRDWLVFLDDDDPLPDPGTLGHVLAFARERLAAEPVTAGVALRGSRFDARRGSVHPVMRPGLTGPIPVDYLHGGFFACYRVAAIRRVGVFEARYFFQWADVEYGLRLRTAGYRLWVSADLWNRFAPAMGHPPELATPMRTLGPADARRYYTMRNRFHLLRRYGRSGSALRVFALAAIAKPLANLPRTPALAIEHLSLNLRAAVDAARGRYGPGPEPWASQSPSPVEDVTTSNDRVSLRQPLRDVG